MKIQINGFDIELNTEEANLAIKVLDSNGKELSNNTYTQSNETSDDINNVDIPAVEDTAQPAQETPEGEDVQPAQPGVQEEPTIEKLILGYEDFKKLNKK